MLVVVLKDWVKGDAMGIERLDQLGEVRQRAGQPIDLIDDDDVDPPGLDIDEQVLERQANHRAAAEAAVVVTIPNQSPALVRLALDVGLARGRQSNSIRRCVARHARSHATPYPARARHSVNAIERLCL